MRAGVSNSVQPELKLVTDEAKLRKRERDRIVESFVVLSIPLRERAEILEAINSDKWDWYKDCDGCTAVTEVYWPNKYFPPCVRHDFDWGTGKGGIEANARFYRIQQAYGMSRVRAGARWLGVTVSWFGWYKWYRRIKKAKGDK